MAFHGSAFVVINSTTALSVVLGIGGGGPRQVTTQSLPAFRGSHTRERQGDSELSAHKDAVARVFSAHFPAMWGVESDSMAAAPSVPSSTPGHKLTKKLHSCGPWNVPRA